MHIKKTLKFVWKLIYKTRNCNLVSIPGLIGVLCAEIFCTFFIVLIKCFFFSKSSLFLSTSLCFRNMVNRKSLRSKGAPVENGMVNGGLNGRSKKDSSIEMSRRDSSIDIEEDDEPAFKLVLFLFADKVIYGIVKLLWRNNWCASLRQVHTEKYSSWIGSASQSKFFSKTILSKKICTCIGLERMVFPKLLRWFEEFISVYPVDTRKTKSR